MSFRAPTRSTHSEGRSTCVGGRAADAATAPGAPASRDDEPTFETLRPESRRPEHEQHGPRCRDRRGNPAREDVPVSNALDSCMTNASTPNHPTGYPLGGLKMVSRPRDGSLFRPPSCRRPHLDREGRSSGYAPTSGAYEPLAPVTWCRNRAAVIVHPDEARALPSAGRRSQAWDPATIYRNLTDLSEAGLARRTDVGDHVWRFEARSSGIGRRRPSSVVT